jgi:hypothetical protein
MMIGSRGRVLLLALGLSGLLALPAQAIQFTPAAEDRLNNITSGLNGTGYENNPGDVDYDMIGGGGAHPGEVFVTGTIAQLEYHKTTAPAIGLNFPFGTPLTFTLEAAIASVNVVPVFGSFVTLSLRYASTPDSLPDLVVKDPTDNTVLLEANLVSGVLFNAPVPALAANFTFNAAAPPASIVGSSLGFFQATGGVYASLFANAIGGLQSGLVTSFSPAFSTVVGAFNATGNLISHTAEADGLVWVVDSSQFVIPEPSTGLLVGMGLLVGLAGMRWTNRS